MAIQAPAAELLILCRRYFPHALDFIMIGRQWLRLRTEDVQRLSREHHVDVNDLADPAGTDTVYAEPLLARIGLRSIRALDASAYEGADIVQDLNQPLKPELRECCDLLFDGGSLEHVFDFPSAIRNCTQMLRPGGLFITACPVNNWMGHGFYQFSPELFFRVFSPSHGFEPRFAALHVRAGKTDRFWSIKDPEETGKRLQYNPTGRMTLLFVAEKKSGENSAFTVQQSDYSARWKNKILDGGGVPDPAAAESLIKQLARHCLPEVMKRAIRDHRVTWRKTLAAESVMRPSTSLEELWKQWNP